MGSPTVVAKSAVFIQFLAIEKTKTHKRQLVLIAINYKSPNCAGLLGRPTTTHTRTSYVALIDLLSQLKYTVQYV